MRTLARTLVCCHTDAPLLRSIKAAHTEQASRRLNALASFLSLLLCISLSTNSASAQRSEEPQAAPEQASEQAAEQTSPGVALRGTVTNSLTHQPVAHALVSLDQYGAATLTDNEGRFAFTGVPVGDAMLTVRHPGYTGDEPGSSETRRSVSVLSSALDASLTLTPRSSISGELLLSNEDVPDNMQVQLLRREIEDGRGHWSVYRSSEVWSDGRFRFGNLPAGAYLVHASASLDPAPALEPDDDRKPRSGYVPAFYPGVRDMTGAGVVTLSPGQQVDLKLALSREPYYQVLVPVANAASLRNLGFSVASDSFLGLGARYSLEDGLVHMELPSGHYRLEGRSYGYGPMGMSGVREFDVNAGVARPGAITLFPVNRIPVTVHDELTHPPAASDARVLAAPDKLSLNLQAESSGPGNRSAAGNLQQDQGGPQADHGVLEGVAPGRYWVNAHAFSGYVASLTSGGVDLLANPLVVGPDGSASPIEVTLRDDTATLSAILAPALQQPPTGVRTPVYLQLVPQSTGAVEMTQTFAADGSLQLSSLAPGTYTAFAASSRSRQQMEYRDPRVMAALAQMGQTLTLEPGGNAHITIDRLADPVLETPSAGSP